MVWGADLSGPGPSIGAVGIRTDPSAGTLLAVGDARTAVGDARTAEADWVLTAGM